MQHKAVAHNITHSAMLESSVSSSKAVRLLRIPNVQDRTGLSRSSICRLMASDDFPKSVSLGEQGRAWLESEVEHWINARVAERDAAMERR